MKITIQKLEYIFLTIIASFIVVFFISFYCIKPTMIESRGEVVTLPLLYELDSMYKTKVVVDKDTILVNLDTGWAVTNLKEIGDELDSIGEGKSIGFRGVTKASVQYRLDEMSLGSINLRNQRITNIESVSSNFLGANELSRFCVKFDNEARVVQFSTNPDAINKAGVSVPIRIQNKSNIFVKMKINDVEAEFFIDSGAETEEIILSDSLYSAINHNRYKKKYWRGTACVGVFSFDSLLLKDKVACMLLDCKLREKKIKNIMALYDEI